VPLASSESLRDPVRLAAVARTELLDGPPDAALARLSRLAARLIGTPVALVSLVDGDRRWFAGATGLGDHLRGTPLTHSFCRHVVASGAPLVVAPASSA